MAYETLNRRKFLRVGGAGLAAWAVAPPLNAQTAPARPNIVLYVADDLGWRDLGCYGSPNAKTPNLDRLAAEGIRFTNAFTATPVCGATRSQLYTGLFPARSHSFFNHPSHLVKPDTRSLATYMKALGYRVGIAGKIDAGPPECYPFELIKRGEEEAFVARRKDEPFCLVVGDHQPHWQWNAKGVAYDPARIVVPDHLIDTPDIRRALADYYGDVSDLDAKVGACLEMLKRQEADANTLFVFTSEQGAEFPFGKYTLFDNGIRLAFIVRWPGRIKPGAVSDAMIQHVDVTPTLVAAAGGLPPDNLDGRSFLSVLTGESHQHRDAIYGVLPEARAVRDTRHKFILNLQPDAPVHTTYSPINPKPMKGFEFTQSWRELAKTDPAVARRVAWFEKRPPEELYDIVKDPFELRNLAEDSTHAKTLAEMRAKLKAWMGSQGDEGWATTNAMKAWQQKQRKEGKDYLRDSDAPFGPPAKAGKKTATP